MQGLVQALQGKVKVKSPTFTIMNVYPVQFKKITQVVHVDYYRVQDANQDLGLQEFEKKDTVIITEWPSKLQTKKSSIIIALAQGKKQNERLISITFGKHGKLPRSL